MIYEDEIYEYNTSPDAIPDAIPKYRYPEGTPRYPDGTNRYPNSGGHWSQWDRVNYVKDPVLEDDDDAAMILFDTLFNSSVNLSCDSILFLVFPAVMLVYYVTAPSGIFETVVG